MSAGRLANDWVDHPVIRNKLPRMARQIEATHAWMEAIVYQVRWFAPGNVRGCFRLARAREVDVVAFLVGSGGGTQTMPAPEGATSNPSLRTHPAPESAGHSGVSVLRPFGGLAYTRGGQGEKIERLYREVRAYAILGGSAEIMLDFGTRQSAMVR
ncbi:MAG: hypothetical protein BJ554DRAFT_500 [Olpidium bornovanus]|uniref:Acyl-CoA dehydrogenase/oxidase C-terminal domain-containing protein n=1 Tax=Olpidium bornovanus TaxID=278681 RepID=A0A8H7ZTG3_9FUNG|nr:MAG: hypothetical protein BJ554DRAFT_500 [Olpidium bornovanus]